DKGGSEAALLAHFGKTNPEIVPEIIRLMTRIRTSDGPGLQANLVMAMLAVSEFGPTAKEAVPILEKHLAAPHLYTALSAAFALLRIDPDHSGAIRLLTKTASSGNAQERDMLGGILWPGTLDRKLLLPLLRVLVEHTDAQERDLHAACRALANSGCGDDVIVAALRKRFSDG